MQLLQALPLQEPSYDFPHIPLLAIHFVIKLAHFGVGNFSREAIKCLAKLGVFCQRLLANDRDSLIWRKVVLVVFEHEQVERGYESVGHIAGNYVNLMIFESASEEAEVHDSRWRGEMQAVGRGQPLVAVRALHEFITECGTPLRRVLSG